MIKASSASWASAEDSRIFLTGMRTSTTEECLHKKISGAKIAMIARSGTVRVCGKTDFHYGQLQRMGIRTGPGGSGVQGRNEIKLATSRSPLLTNGHTRGFHDFSG